MHDNKIVHGINFSFEEKGMIFKVINVCYKTATPETYYENLALIEGMLDLAKPLLCSALSYRQQAI